MKQMEAIELEDALKMGGGREGNSLPLGSSVTLRKSLNVSVPQFFHCKMRLLTVPTS